MENKTTYIPTLWEDGQQWVDANALNNIETGIINAHENKADKTPVSASANGLMTSVLYTEHTDMKTKLNGIAPNANNYVHPNDYNTRHISDVEKGKIGKVDGIETKLQNHLDNHPSGGEVSPELVEQKVVEVINKPNSPVATKEQLNTKVDKTDTNLETNSKNVTGAINELHRRTDISQSLGQVLTIGGVKYDIKIHNDGSIYSEPLAYPGTIPAQFNKPVVQIPSPFPGEYLLADHVSDGVGLTKCVYKMNSVGEIVWIKELDDYATDFKSIQIDGKTYYSYVKNIPKDSSFPNIEVPFYNHGVFIVMDEDFVIIDEVRLKGHGNILDNHPVDMHEGLVLGHNHYLVIGYILLENKTDGSGNKLIEACVQEIKDGKLLFSWESVDYEKCLTDSTHAKVAQGCTDYVHLNSVCVDVDGNYILSCRATNCLYKIDRVGGTGNIIWTLGGKTDEFKLTQIQKPFGQHQVTITNDGCILVFDNAVNSGDGGSNPNKTPARVLKYKIDEKTKTLLDFKGYSLGILTETPSMATGGVIKIHPTKEIYLVNMGMNASCPDIAEIDFTDANNPKIIARIKRGGWYRAFKKTYSLVERNYEEVGVSGLELNITNKTLNINDSTLLKAIFTPSNVANKNVTWSSSNPNIAKVSKNGVVYGLTQGSCKITCTANADITKTASCDINVTNVNQRYSFDFRGYEQARVEDKFVVTKAPSSNQSTLTYENDVLKVNDVSAEGAGYIILKCLNMPVGNCNFEVDMNVKFACNFDGQIAEGVRLQIDDSNSGLQLLFHQKLGLRYTKKTLPLNEAIKICDLEQDTMYNVRAVCDFKTNTNIVIYLNGTEILTLPYSDWSTNYTNKNGITLYARTSVLDVDSVKVRYN